MSRLIALLATTISTSAIVLACTVTTTSPAPGSENASSSGSTGTTPKTDSGTDDDGNGDGGGTGGGTGDGTCKDEGNQCSPCCIDKHQAGNKTFDDAFVACACGAQGACSAECADYACATPARTAPSQSPCDLCLADAFLTDTGACKAKQKETCDKDPDCVALYTCIGKCPEE